MTYIWKFNGPPEPMVLRRRTEKSMIFVYPATSLSAGKDWRMSLKTFEDYVRKGVITIKD